MITFNIEGFSRNNFYLSELLNLSPKLLFLQEIWAPYSQEYSMSKMFPNYNIQISSPDMFTAPEDLLCTADHAWHGSAIMWHSSLDSHVLNLKTTNSRFTSIRLSTQDQKFIAVSVYFPTSGKDDEYLECTSDLINFSNDNLREDENILMGIDSNCSEKSSPRRKLALKNLCQELDLIKVSTSLPTFHHHNGSSESNIDYFLVSKRCASNLSNLVLHCTLDIPENFSSHDPISASLYVPVTSQSTAPTVDYSHTYTEFNQVKVVWDAGDADKLDMYQLTAAKVLSEYDAMFPLLEHLPLKCELFSSLLVKCAEICMETKPAKKIAMQKRKQAWLKLRKSFKAWKISGKSKDQNNDVFTKYKEARSIFQKRYRYEADLQDIRKNNNIMNANFNNKKKFYNIIKNMRSKKLSQAPTVLNTPAGRYSGQNVLEGFTRDAEILGQAEGDATAHDNEFYKLCKLDNLYIFEFKGNGAIVIPEMKIEDLENILNKGMKLGKACDVYKLTVEHLRYAGPQAKQIILSLLNDIIKNIYYLTCPQVKKGLSTAAYKGKGKPLDQASSYRRITVTPQVGAIIDHYIDPIAEEIFLRVQSSDQLGFTKGVSYLLAAVERGECQRYALDTKQTCFGVSFDGQAAFPSVERSIQVRELYSCGETGDLLKYSNNTYQNTDSHMKQDGKLGRLFREDKGSRQGHKRAAGHFKSYINPCLLATNSSELGFWIGPICVTCICVADDTYILSGDSRQLQAIIDIVGHYGHRYQVTFGADKTKVTVTGSKIDMSYYRDIQMWSLAGDTLPVTEDNDHLGLIVSGLDEEQKNIDKNIDAAWKTLFGLLGNIFAFNCKISQTAILHVWTLYVNPVMRSGLAALPIRPPVMKTATTFHHKILRGILKLGPMSPLPPLYFLLGEFPVEARIHLDTPNTFWCI